MTITNYTQLKSAIADFLNRDDLTAVIPTFIALAEADINRTVRHWRMEKRSTASIDSRYSALPGDYLETIRFHLDVDERPLEMSGSYELQQSRTANEDTIGRPQLFAIVGGQIEVWPTPDTAYTGELYYISRTDALSDENASNWLLQYYPDAYLYGALTHSAPYLSEDQRAQIWAALYQNAVNAINTESEMAKTNASGLRMRVKAY